MRRASAGRQAAEYQRELAFRDAQRRDSPIAAMLQDAAYRVLEHELVDARRDVLNLLVLELGAYVRAGWAIEPADALQVGQGLTEALAAAQRAQELDRRYFVLDHARRVSTLLWNNVSGSGVCHSCWRRSCACPPPAPRRPVLSAEQTFAGFSDEASAREAR